MMMKPCHPMEDKDQYNPVTTQELDVRSHGLRLVLLNLLVSELDKKQKIQHSMFLKHAQENTFEKYRTSTQTS